MQVDLSTIRLEGIDGKRAKHVKGEKSQGVHNTVAFIMYTMASNLDLVDIAQQMHKGGPVEMAASHIAEMRTLLAEPSNGFMAYARKAVFDYLDDLEKKGHDKKSKKDRRKNK